MKTILITGTSTGFGHSAVKRFAANGWNVIATMRTPEKDNSLRLLDNVLVTRLDVQDTASIHAAVAAGIERFGKIDALINNAGYGLMGPFELTTNEQVHNQFDVNVFGLMDTIRAILPHFRANKAGLIINISSMGGRVAFPAISLYHATKFAVEGFTESLSYELAQFNITVKLIEPGVVNTPFNTSVTVAADASIKEYDEYVARSSARWAELNPDPDTVEDVVSVIYTAATDGTDQLRYIATSDAANYIKVKQSTGDQEYMDWMKARFDVS
jgi:NAD(P)-dependent dehydrogenase (short-subunit alcohol dehydrogenase family)